MEPPRPSALLNSRGPLMQVGAMYRSHGFGRDSPREVRIGPGVSCDLTHRAAPSSALNVGRLEPRRNRLDAGGKPLDAASEHRIVVRGHRPLDARPP